MIYTDGIFLISDNSVKELHEFAQTIGLGRKHFENKRYPHYTIWGIFRKRSKNNKAEFISTREIIFKLRKLSEKLEHEKNSRLEKII